MIVTSSAYHSLESVKEWVSGESNELVSWRIPVPDGGGGGVKLLAAVALLGLAFFVVSAGGASAAEPEPPEVRSGTAQSNCQRIVDAGFSTDDYVLSGGRWQHRPDWTGADGARMSRIWGSVAICRGEYSLDRPEIRYQPQPTFDHPAPSNSGVGSGRTVTTVRAEPTIRTEPAVRTEPAPTPQPKITEEPAEVVEQREEEVESQPHSTTSEHTHCMSGILRGGQFFPDAPKHPNTNHGTPNYFRARGQGTWKSGGGTGFGTIGPHQNDWFKAPRRATVCQ